MISAKIDNQLMVSVENKIGTLAEVTEIIAEAGINLIAIYAYAVDEKGFIALVTEDNKKALKLLESNNYDVREEEIVIVSLNNKPGTLQALADAIAAAGVDLVLLYGSVGQDGKTTRLILVSEDNQAVLSVAQMGK